MARAKRTWILVADGSRAKVYESPGHGSALREIFHEEAAALRTREIVSDRGGRRGDTVGGGRHDVGTSSDPQRHNERAFARHVCEFLDRAAGERAFDRLILTAAPATLGDIRDLLSKASRARVAAELDKDLVSVAPGELAGRLAEIVRL